MKCEKCGNKETTFYYSATINGEKSECRLCADCAREEGFGGALDYRPVSLFDDMISDFFGSSRSFFPSFGRFEHPMHRIMSPVMPRIHLVVGQPSVESREESEEKIPADAGADMKARRELEALKHQLSEAVKAEDFEKAIELRDKIRGMEKE